VYQSELRYRKTNSVNISRTVFAQCFKIGFYQCGKEDKKKWWTGLFILFIFLFKQFTKKLRRLKLTSQQTKNLPNSMSKQWESVCNMEQWILECRADTCLDPSVKVPGVGTPQRSVERSQQKVQVCEAPGIKRSAALLHLAKLAGELAHLTAQMGHKHGKRVATSCQHQQQLRQPLTWGWL